jgi:hypothetical protein
MARLSFSRRNPASAVPSNHRLHDRLQDIDRDGHPAARALGSRQAELQFELGSAGPEKIGEDDLDYLCDEVKRIILEGNPRSASDWCTRWSRKSASRANTPSTRGYRLPHSPVPELGGLVAQRDSNSRHAV